MRTKLALLVVFSSFIQLHVSLLLALPTDLSITTGEGGEIEHHRRLLARRPSWGRGSCGESRSMPTPGHGCALGNNLAGEASGGDEGLQYTPMVSAIRSPPTPASVYQKP